MLTHMNSQITVCDTFIVALGALELFDVFMTQHVYLKTINCSACNTTMDTRIHLFLSVRVHVIWHIFSSANKCFTELTKQSSLNFVAVDFKVSLEIT